MHDRRRLQGVFTAGALVALMAFAAGCGSSDDSSSSGASKASDTTAAAAKPGWTTEANFIDCKAPTSKPNGCDGKKVPGTYEALGAGTASKAWRICVSVPHLKDPYWVAVDYGVAAEAKRAGVKMDLLDAGGYTNLPKQISQLDNCVAQGADAVVIGGISFDGLDAKIQEFASQGIPVVDIMNGLSSPKVNAHALVDFYDMGTEVGKHLASLGKPLKVAWLPGPPGAGWVDSANRGFKDAIKGSQVKVLTTKFGDTGKEVQLGLVENVLQTYPDVDYIAGTAVTAEAAVTAIDERGMQDKVKVIADYMIPTTYDLIKKGAVECAPTDSPVVQAEMGIDMALRLLEKKGLVNDMARSGPQVKLICGDAAGAKANVADFETDTTFAPSGFKPVASAG